MIFSSKVSIYSTGCRHSHYSVPAISSTNCGVFSTVTAACSSIAFSCTALLFFFRLRAIYNQNRITIWSFFVLWLAIPAVSIWSTCIIASGIHLEDEAYPSFKYCPDLVTNIQAQFLYTQSTTLAYDTLVFIAISRRLCRISYLKPQGPRESLKLLLFGKYLPIFTKSLYLDGQAYYL